MKFVLFHGRCQGNEGNKFMKFTTKQPMLLNDEACCLLFPLSIKLLNRIFHLLYFPLQNSDILNLGTGSVSWFEANGPGCKPIFSTNGTLEDRDPFRPIRPDRVEGCYLDYWIIEIIHSAVQIFFTVSASMNIQSQSSPNLYFHSLNSSCQV